MLDECGIINVLSLFSKIRQSLRNKLYQILPPPNWFYSSECQSLKNVTLQVVS